MLSLPVWQGNWWFFWGSCFLPTGWLRLSRRDRYHQRRKSIFIDPVCFSRRVNEWVWSSTWCRRVSRWHSPATCDRWRLTLWSGFNTSRGISLDTCVTAYNMVSVMQSFPMCARRDCLWKTDKSKAHVNPKVRFKATSVHDWLLWLSFLPVSLCEWWVILVLSQMLSDHSLASLCRHTTELPVLGEGRPRTVT